MAECNPLFTPASPICLFSSGLNPVDGCGGSVGKDPSLLNANGDPNTQYLPGSFEGVGASYYNVVDFGALPWADNPSSDDSPAIQAAINHALVNGVGAVFIPRGTYNLQSTIQIGGNDKPAFEAGYGIGTAANRALTVYGDWPVLKAENEEMNAVLELGTARYLSVERLILAAAGRATYGVLASRLVGGATLDRVTVHGAALDGFNLSVLSGGVFRSCASEQNGRHGWLIQGANNSTFDTCSARCNTEDGFRISGAPAPGPDQSGACYLTSVLSSGNGGVGVHVTDYFDEEYVGWPAVAILVAVPTTGVVVQNGVAAENEGDGVLVESSNTTVSGLRILAGEETLSTSRCIRVTADARGCNIQGNMVAGDESFAQIRVLGDQAVYDSHWVQANFHSLGAGSVFMKILIDEPVNITALPVDYK